MPIVFVDTSFLIASYSEHDSFHERAVAVGDRLFSDGGSRFVVTVMVIEEFLTDMARDDVPLKLKAIDFTRRVLDAPTFDIVDVDRALLERGIDLYESRLDKAYSMVDCISMVVCRHLSITDVLTTDRDFEREGFVALLREA